MRKMAMKLSICSLTLACFGQAAYGQTSKITEASETRGEIFCFPAKGVPKIFERINGIDAKRRDVVDVTLDPKFIIKDGGAWPEAFYLAKDGVKITDMPVSHSDGRVANFIEAVKAEPNSDICALDPSRAARPVDDEGLYFELGLSPFFHTATGEHDIDTLTEGMRDGKTFYKKMIPAGLRMFMPDTNYVAVKYKDKALQGPQARAQIFARVGEQEIAIDTERHKELFVASGKTLRGMDANALIVRGGAYELFPVPSPSIMRRFFAGEGDDGVSEEEAKAIALETVKLESSNLESSNLESSPE